MAEDFPDTSGRKFLFLVVYGKILQLFTAIRFNFMVFQRFPIPYF